MEVFIILGSIALVIAAFVWGYYYNEKVRREKFAEVAEERGLAFHPKGNPKVTDALSEFRLFTIGRGRKVVNMLCGNTEDVELALFGYWFYTGGGDSRRGHKQTVISFRSPHLSLPKFELRPEGFFHKIGQAFGAKDIDIDSSPGFSKRYLLKGDDEAAIRDLFTPELVSHLETQEKVSIEGQGAAMIFYRARKRIDPGDIQPFLEEGFRLYGLLKQASTA